MPDCPRASSRKGSLHHIRKFVYYLLSRAMWPDPVLFIGTMAGWPPVLAAVQLLWLNLITDGAPVPGAGHGERS